MIFFDQQPRNFALRNPPTPRGNPQSLPYMFIIKRTNLDASA